eukprot:COSAG02_NODE_1345_length_13143_cov_61.223091_9_plen_130_part_00
MRTDGEGAEGVHVLLADERRHRQPRHVYPKSLTRAELRRPGAGGTLRSERGRVHRTAGSAKISRQAAERFVVATWAQMSGCARGCISSSALACLTVQTRAVVGSIAMSAGIGECFKSTRSELIRLRTLQ